MIDIHTPRLWHLTLTLIIVTVLLALMTGLLRASGPTDGINLYLQAGIFDPLTAPLFTLPAGVAGNAATETYAIIQFGAPPTSVQRIALTSTGAILMDYVPDYAYIVRVPAGGKQRLAALPGVRWTDNWRPAYRVHPMLWGSTGTITITMQFFPGSEATVEAQTVVDRPGVRMLSTALDTDRAILRLETTAGTIGDLAALTHVRWIEPYVPPTLNNDIATEITGITDVWHNLEITGTGQIIAIADTGLDLGITGPITDFTDRVIEGQCIGRVTPCAWDDPQGHGTHVAGTAAGSGALSQGQLRGAAPGAALVIQSLYSSTQPGGIYVPPDLGTLLAPAYDAGARVHNNSWGSPGNRYDTWAETLDRFVWEHPDMVVVAAAGNDSVDRGLDGLADPGNLNTPAIAKNAVAVGATESLRPGNGYTGTYGTSPSGSDFPANPIRDDTIADAPDGLAAFSSRGPTADSRIGVDLVAPGTNILSARSHHPSATYPFVLDAHYAYQSGSSQAAPLVSGAAALIRQWYQEQGSLTPSAALVRATLLNGTTDLTPGQYGTRVAGSVLVSDTVTGGGVLTSTTWVITDTYGAHSDTIAWVSPGGLGIRRLDASVDLAATTTPTLRIWNRRWLAGTYANVYVCGVKRPIFSYNDGGYVGWSTVDVDLTPCAGNSTALIRFETQCLVAARCGADFWAIDDMIITEGGRIAEVTASPDSNQGWGRLNLATSLTIPEDGTLWYLDDTQGLQTGETFTRSLAISDAALPMRITLTWSDYPATPAAAIALVNDLDLIVISPDGQRIYANGGTEPDRRDTVEQVTITQPATGTYTFAVQGINVPMGPQPFALVLSAGGKVLPSPLYLPLVFRS